jgi:hypothetical protein
MQPEFHLTPEEAVLVSNSGWLITKQRIVGKVYGMFGMLSEKYSEILQDYQDFIPPEVMSVSPKIYKGEMYRQMPYVMLDHPRYFDKNDVFAIRSFFWWGNHFSIHLLLAGRYRERYEQSLLTHINSGTLDQWYLGVSEDPWEHHFEEDNYQQVHQLRSHKAVHTSLPYFKLANWHSLDDWKAAYQFYLNSYTQILECIA